MKEEEIKKIMKQSFSSPSEKFTDNVIEQLNNEKELVRGVNLTIIFTILVCVICIVLLSLFSLPAVNVLDYIIHIPKEIIQVAGLVFILYEFHQIYGLKRNLEILRTQ